MKVEIKDGILSITVGTDLLCRALQADRDWPEELSITNNDGFAKDLLDELVHEQEEGTTVVHEMLDKAAMSAVENGSEHATESQGDERE